MVLTIAMTNKLCVYPVVGDHDHHDHRRSLCSEKYWNSKGGISCSCSCSCSCSSSSINYERKEIYCSQSRPTATTTTTITKSIGILNFFQGKNIFLTGATGLLGKVLVEKILRSTSVGKIYVLVKAEDREAAMERLAKEVINSELYRCLEEKHGKYYQELMREKLIPVVGNICEPNLGMDSHSARTIMEDVNIIIESAAITTLNERYDLLLHTNVNGPQRLMSFAKSCKNLQILVHFSTVFVNGDKEGIVLETPLIKGEYTYTSRLDDELRLALRSCNTSSSNYEISRHMKRIGKERANSYGWHNAYHMTKAMAEMGIHEDMMNIPVVIIRPSVIESCYQQPFPGWIQGNRMYDPVIIAYGKGQLPAFLGDPDTPVDIIPLDIVVNATIAAIAKHGQMHKSKSESELAVYQIASSVANPLLHKDFFNYLYDYFTSDPLIELKNFAKISYYDNVAEIKFFDNFHDFSQYSRQEIARRLGITKDDRSRQLKLKASAAYAEQLCKLYEFAGFYKGRFESENVQTLLSEMSKEEQAEFFLDIKNIDWRKFIQLVHIPGLRKHVLNDNIYS